MPTFTADKIKAMDIFVGSLPFKMKDKGLKELFEPYGEVESVKIIIDKATRQNKGFGFVVMPNDAEANKAINELDGKEIMGRTIIVSKSEEKKPEPKRRKNFGKGGTNLKGDFDKAKKDFPGKSGFQKSSTRGAARSNPKGGGRRGR